MMPEDGGRRRKRCLLVTHVRLWAARLCEKVPLQRARLVSELDVLDPVPEFAHFDWRHLMSRRYRVRCAFAFCCVFVVMYVLIAYVTPRTAWFNGVGTGGNTSCTMKCLPDSTGEVTWAPRIIRGTLPCQEFTSLPIPCPANRTHSELLKIPPIHFLGNFKTPCWYEPISWDGFSKGHPYVENLFACFARNARTVFKELLSEWMLRATIQTNPKRLRCMPYFYIVGQPKCGSTDLYFKITLHPDVVRPPMKEPHWWSKNRFGMRLNYSSLIPLQDYVDLFDKAAMEIERRTDSNPSHSKSLKTDDDDSSPTLYHSVITGDASASTLWDNDDWWRLPENCGRLEPLFTNAHFIRRITPDAKIIIILRHPAERLYSDYLYFHKTNKSVAEFHEQVLLSIAKLRECASQRSLRSCVYDRRVASGFKVRLRIGLYHLYVSEWLNVFPREQILVIRMEDYASQLHDVISDVFNFLGLRPLRRDEERKVMNAPIVNARKQGDRDLGDMLNATSQLLYDFYLPHNHQLASLLGDSRFLWADIAGAKPEVRGLDGKWKPQEKPKDDSFVDVTQNESQDVARDLTYDNNDDNLQGSRDDRNETEDVTGVEIDDEDDYNEYNKDENYQEEYLTYNNEEDRDSFVDS